MKTNVKIPVEKLEGGIEKCKVQSKVLFDSGEILLKKKKYVTAISLLILAREELTKIRIFSKYYKANKPIDDKTWKFLTQHKEKLGITYLHAYYTLKKLSIESIMQVREMYRKEGVQPVYGVADRVKPPNLRYVALLECLDFLKQDCQFVNWIDNDWFSIFENYDKKLQEDVATVMYYDWLGEYYPILLSQKYKKGDPIEIPKTITGNKYRKILKYTESPQFIKLRTRIYKRILSDFEPRHKALVKKRIKKLKAKTKKTL